MQSFIDYNCAAVMLSLSLSLLLSSKGPQWSCPMQAPGRNALLIHLLILALYAMFACLLGHLLPFFFTYFPCLPTYLTFPLKMGPLCFQARGRKRRPNLGSFLELCSWCMVILHCSKFSYSRSPRFIIYFCGSCSCFWFCFLRTNQEIGWEEHLGNDLYCVEWDVKP